MKTVSPGTNGSYAAQPCPTLNFSWQISTMNVNYISSQYGWFMGLNLFILMCKRDLRNSYSQCIKSKAVNIFIIRTFKLIGLSAKGQMCSLGKYVYYILAPKGWHQKRLKGTKSARIRDLDLRQHLNWHRPQKITKCVTNQRDAEDIQMLCSSSLGEKLEAGNLWTPKTSFSYDTSCVENPAGCFFEDIQTHISNGFAKSESCKEECYDHDYDEDNNKVYHLIRHMFLILW
jgi:hypothetical protein